MVGMTALVQLLLKRLQNKNLKRLAYQNLVTHCVRNKNLTKQDEIEDFCVSENLVTRKARNKQSLLLAYARNN